MRISGLRRGGDNRREYWHQIATVAEGVGNALSTERTALPESREAFSDSLCRSRAARSARQAHNLKAAGSNPASATNSPERA